MEFIADAALYALNLVWDAIKFTCFFIGAGAATAIGLRIGYDLTVGLKGPASVALEVFENKGVEE